MAQKHKAATQVTIASTSEETALSRWVERYWKHAVGAALVFTIVVIGRQWMASQDEAKSDLSWDRLRQDVSFGGGFRPDNGFPNPAAVQAPSPAILAGLSDELKDDPAGAWAKALQVGRLLQEEDYETAAQVASELEASFPDHPIVTTGLPWDESGNLIPLPEFVQSRIQAMNAWENSHNYLFANPELPPGSPRVRISTSEGEIVLGLYADIAPKTVENFLKLCGEGFYDGLKFHQVVPGSRVVTGDPNSLEGEPETWGDGGPEEGPVVEPGLRHFPYVVGMHRERTAETSHGSQFYLTAGELHGYDLRQTVFGVVVEGQAVVDAIAATPIQAGRPENPPTIQGTEVL